MILYYAMNLFLLRENDNALHMIQECANKVKGGMLYESNLNRIEGLLWLNKSEIKKSLECFEKAKEKFKGINCIYG
jgi:hypothetical protein